MYLENAFVLNGKRFQKKQKHIYSALGNKSERVLVWSRAESDTVRRRWNFDFSARVNIQ